MPQACLDAYTESSAYGISKNPWNLDRTTGGSSGGEGGLISSRCSPLGVGTDIAGSIRIPASFCGVTSFKPTTFRAVPHSIEHVSG